MWHRWHEHFRGLMEWKSNTGAGGGARVSRVRGSWNNEPICFLAARQRQEQGTLAKLCCGCEAGSWVWGSRFDPQDLTESRCWAIKSVCCRETQDKAEVEQAVLPVIPALFQNSAAKQTFRSLITLEVISVCEITQTKTRGWRDDLVKSIEHPSNRLGTLQITVTPAPENPAPPSGLQGYLHTNDSKINP